MVEFLGALGALILLCASVAAGIAVFRSKRVEENQKLLITSNDELREALQFERDERHRDNNECSRKLGEMQSQIDVLAGHIGRKIGEGIAEAVFDFLRRQSSSPPRFPPQLPPT